MVRIIVSILVCFNCIIGYGQSEPQFTQYMYNKYLFNPASAGSTGGLEVSALYRNQYVELTSQAISAQGVNFNIPIYKISSGMGVTVVNDLIGFQRATYISLSYDYRKIFPWGKMGIGVSGGLIQTSLDGGKLRASDGDYSNGNVNHLDSYLPISLQQAIAPDISFGIFFNNEKYFAGASINHLVFSSAHINTNTKTKLSFSRNLVFLGGSDFKISRRFLITPSALIKTDLKKVQVDISSTFCIIDNILTGMSLRGYTKNMIDALAVLAGFKFKGFRLIYSYDINLSYASRFNSGSHEISLNYQYAFSKKEGRGYFYHNPRFD
jgi:type IX secretion system PorP/SprF family membrane protein